MTTQLQSQQSILEAGLVQGIISLLIVTGLVAIWFGSSLPRYLIDVHASSETMSNVHAILGKIAWYRRLGVGTGLLVGSALNGGPSISAAPVFLGFAIGSVGAGLNVRSNTDMGALPAWFGDLVNGRVIYEPATVACIAVLAIALNATLIWGLVAWAAWRNLDLGQRRRPTFPTPTHSVAT